MASVPGTVSDRVISPWRESAAREQPPTAQAREAVIGLSGASRNPAAAVAIDGRLEAFCEEHRVTRNRAGLAPGEYPREALAAALASVADAPHTVAAVVTGEQGIGSPDGAKSVRLDHHYCHAATAFLTSSFDDAAVLVCDQNAGAELSVWRGSGTTLVNLQCPWRGQAFASIFSRCAELFGFPRGQEHRFEALARTDPAPATHDFSGLFTYAAWALRIDPAWEQIVSGRLHDRGRHWSVDHGAHVAASIQRALAEALLALLNDIRVTAGASRLCLGGGLFYNTFLNAAVAGAGIFEEVFVAPNPGNAGIAAGAALAISLRDSERRPGAVSQFLGPAFTADEIKATLDNCKLSYECLSEGEVLRTAVDALMAGRLVGWFHGRMEWAHRALGNRSILASPLSPYVLENLNGFLKQRERYRAYSLSVCEEDAHRYFDGPTRSSWMEYDYRVIDTERLRHSLPAGVSTVRVHTVDASPSPLRSILKAFADASGTAVLVNTSFNGFSEPIVCSPRDAIRVFYGTGLDLLVLDRFVVRK